MLQEERHSKKFSAEQARAKLLADASRVYEFCYLFMNFYRGGGETPLSADVIAAHKTLQGGCTTSRLEQTLGLSRSWNAAIAADLLTNALTP